MYLESNCKIFKMHKIHMSEGDLKLADIDIKNVGENELTPRMKYIMVRLYNCNRKLVQEV